jgi:Flp pilus assembly protein TadD/SAM-dependent methyltransferase
MQDLSSALDAAIRFHGAGNLAEAERRYRQILAADPAHADALHLLGLLAYQCGHLAEAEKLIRAAIARNGTAASYRLSLGNVVLARGQAEDACALYREALARKPDMAEAHNNLGSALKELGRLEEAAASYRAALKLRPDFADAWNNLGNVLGLLGRSEEAVAAFRKALIYRAQYPEAHNNLGNALAEQGRLDEAEASIRQALRLNPKLAEAEANLAALLQRKGDVAGAEAGYRAALSLNPNLADIQLKLARLLVSRGDADGALSHVLHALSLRATPEAKRAFAEIAPYAGGDGEALRANMVRALEEPWGHPETLIANGWRLAHRRIALTDAAAPEIIGDPLVRALLTTAPLCDIATEKLFAGIRRGLLEAADQTVPSDLLEFYAALAQQCFLNDYVFAAEAEEQMCADRLSVRLERAIAENAPIAPLQLTAVASYRPLHSLADAARLLERTWPDPIQTLLRQQIREPEAERADSSIPSLTPVDDSVSRAVRRQYEENPYPRWTRLAPAAAPLSLADYLAQRFPLAYRQTVPQMPTRILIAGCGTGRQAIKAAWMYESAQVLALDLSLASLAYASRKTRELGVGGLTYAQADLLHWEGAPFDAIEAVGVLHHMEDPWGAWRKLLALLQPGGVMKLGFYSSLARRDVARARDWIKAHDCQPTPEGIRRFRRDLMEGAAPADLMPVSRFLDFFSLSAARDLLFHVQECALDLPAIKGFVDDSGLRMLGFDCPPGLLAQYRARFPNDAAATDLDQWNLFEQDHPDTFQNMYQFWVQKIA